MPLVTRWTFLHTVKSKENKCQDVAIIKKIILRERLHISGTGKATYRRCILPITTVRRNYFVGS